MLWDIEADMVCTGSGAAGLASAIAGADLGGDVFVAAAPPGEPIHHAGDGPTDDIAVPVRAHADRLHPWLDADVSDFETAEYLAALSSDLGPLALGVDDADLPISVVRDAPVEPGLKVAPFYGARLREWAARCLASPYGFLHTRLSDWWTTTLHTIDGETIEVAEIGSMTIDSDNAGEALFQWLADQAHDRGIDIRPNCALQRIVFEEGEAVGAVFTTPEGPLAVRARYGVTVASSARVDSPPPHQEASAGGGSWRVCLVSRQASRFGRVELLTSQAVEPDAPPTCGQGARQLHVKLRETQGESPSWRCAWGQGYPLLDQ